MKPSLSIALIGLDTSHVSAFTKLLNDPDDPHHIAGAKVTAAYPGGSADLFASYSRVDKFTAELKEKYGVAIVDTPEAAAEAADVVFITSVDGRVHLHQFERVVSYQKPVFVDKPFAVSVEDAEKMLELAERHRIPLMSCSSLRFAGALTEKLRDDRKGEIVGADSFGPMVLEPTNPGFYWYGIHSVEMVFACLGKHCKEVSVVSNEHYDFAVGLWEDGRIGTVRGNRVGNYEFGAVIHRKTGSDFVDVASSSKPYYALLLEEILNMVQTGKSPIDPEETLRIIKFIDAANRSRQSGQPVKIV